jgi:Stress responsive A/B Barrel Domain
MIRNVVVGRLKPGLERTAIEPALAAIAALSPPGLIECRVGTDLRLRDGSWDFAITSTFVDEDAYRAYDLDAEHNRIRREMIAPVSAETVRVQFQA